MKKRRRHKVQLHRVNWWRGTHRSDWHDYSVRGKKIKQAKDLDQVNKFVLIANKWNTAVINIRYHWNLVVSVFHMCFCLIGTCLFTISAFSLQDFLKYSKKANLDTTELEVFGNTAFGVRDVWGKNYQYDHTIIALLFFSQFSFYMLIEFFLKLKSVYIIIY